MVKELEPLFVGIFNDEPMCVDIYFCNDCQQDFACKSDTFQIVSPLSMRDELADDASDASDEVYDGRL
jgi:hypothetical protein